MAPSVIRSSRSFVKPCQPTPSSVLELSVLDKLPVVRSYSHTLHVFRHGPEASKVIKEALSKALVHYYPLAGRLKESSQGQTGLQIDCCGQGVWFVEANAGYSLDSVDYFDNADSIPYDDVLPDQVPKVEGIEPLIQLQVTRFACGGFVIGLVVSHTICDGLGAAQFIIAVSELARGLTKPTVTPVWQRDFADDFKAAVVAKTPRPPSFSNGFLHHVSIDISMDEIKQLKQEFHDLTGKTCSTFDVVAASFWIIRTRAINLKPNTEVRLVFFANCRELLDPALPKGYYGNCVFPIKITASSELLTQASNVEVVKLIREAKAKLPVEFAKYRNGDLFRNGKDPFSPPLAYTTLHIADWGRLGFNQVDYGWGPQLNMVPIPGSRYIPIGFTMSPPLPKKGIRLMTWCVEETHRQPFLNLMKSLI